MIFIDFPIQGELRLPLLILEWLFSLISFQLGLIFFIRYKKPEKELRNVNELGYAFLLLGLSFMWFFYMGADYYASDELVSPFYIWPEGSERMALLTLGYLAVMVGAFICMVLMESIKVYAVRKYFFSSIFMVLMLVFGIVGLIDLSLTQSLSMLFWPLFLIFFFTYMLDFNSKVKEREKRLSGVMKFLSGFMLIAIGFILTTDTSINLLGLEFRLVGAILQLVAILFIFYFLVSLPPFSEFDWKEKLENVFIINKGGICLYSQSYLDNQKETVDENLVSGAISSVNLMLEELTSTKGLTILEKRGKIVTLCPGEFTYGVTFSTEDLKNIKARLKSFIDKFETVYFNVLEGWSGDLDIFKPTENLIKEFF